MVEQTIQVESSDRRLQIPLLLYALFLAAMVLDIGGGFGLKYASLAILGLYVAISFTSERRGLLPGSFFVLEVPLFALAPVFYFVLATGGFSIPLKSVIEGLSPFATWLLYPVLLSIFPRKRLVSMFSTTMFWAAVLIVSVFCSILLLSFVLRRPDLVGTITSFTDTYRLGYFGLDRLGLPNIYFRWTLLLIPATILTLPLSRNRFLIMIVAVLLTQSTAALLFLAIGLVWASLKGLRSGRLSRLYLRRLMLFSALLLVAASALYTAGFGQAIGSMASKLTRLDPSTSVKLGHIESILTIMLKEPATVLLGMGVGSSFYSVGVGGVVTNVEVSYFNLMRQFGLPYAMAFLAYVLAVFFSVRRIDEPGRLLSIGLLCQFVACGTNPLLISPVFFFTLILCRSYITAASREACRVHEGSAICYREPV
jgi:hypothetical protein